MRTIKVNKWTCFMGTDFDNVTNYFRLFVFIYLSWFLIHYINHNNLWVVGLWYLADKHQLIWKHFKGEK